MDRPVEGTPPQVHSASFHACTFLKLYVVAIISGLFFLVFHEVADVDAIFARSRRLKFYVLMIFGRQFELEVGVVGLRSQCG